TAFARTYVHTALHPRIDAEENEDGKTIYWRIVSLRELLITLLQRIRGKVSFLSRQKRRQRSSKNSLENPTPLRNQTRGGVFGGRLVGGCVLGWHCVELGHGNGSADGRARLGEGRQAGRKEDCCCQLQGVSVGSLYTGVGNA
ncbi:hypothetical protein ACLOJK_006733, partial [Asimina triloba]